MEMGYNTQSTCHAHRIAHTQTHTHTATDGRHQFNLASTAIERAKKIPETTFNQNQKVKMLGGGGSGKWRGKNESQNVSDTVATYVYTTLQWQKCVFCVCAAHGERP